MINKIIKNLIFSLAVFAFSAANAQAAISCHVAASCTSSEVDILEMTDTTNAHAGLPGSGYPYAVCCSGPSGLSSSCSGNGQVVAKLSGFANAHARLNTEPDYSGSNNACISVSSGTLTLANQDNDCSGFDTTILSLVKIPTNSHVGDGNAYPHKICAKYKAPTIGGGGWIPNFFGGGSNPNQTPGISSPQPALTVSVPLFSFNVPHEEAVQEDQPAISLDQADIIAQGDEQIDTEPVIQEDALSNSQVAAANQAGSGLANLITSSSFKIGSIILILVLILISRKLYLKRK
jgi:hypothetical protein